MVVAVVINIVVVANTMLWYIAEELHSDAERTLKIAHMYVWR